MAAAVAALVLDRRGVDEGWATAAAALVAVVALAATDQLAPVWAGGAAGATAVGAGLGPAVRLRVRSVDALLAAATACVVAFFVLPDTEAATVVGAALAGPLVVALIDRARWRRAAAGAAVSAALAALAVVGATGAAGAANHDLVLEVTAVTALACAAAVVLVGRLLLGPRHEPGRLTSERARPSR